MAKRFLSIVAAIGMVFAVLLCGSGCTAKSYTEAQHIQRVTKLAEKRYLTEDSPYTSLQVFPLYTENDELGYFVIEFEPYGYAYVKIQQGTRCYIVGMYTRDDQESFVWRRYTIDLEMSGLPKITQPDGRTASYPDCKWEVDSNGNYIDYRASHYKVAEIGQNEKRYLLYTKQAGDYTGGFIPAIKRGERYLNLVSMEEMKYETNLTERKYATAFISFVYARAYQL